MEKLTTKREMISLYRKAFNEILKINSKNLTIKIQAKFEPTSFDFSITVFNQSCKNCTFSFYDFIGLKKNVSMLKEIIKTIKKDNYLEVFNKVAELDDYPLV